MKRFVVWFLTLALLVLPMAAMAETVEATEAPAAWYELSAEDTVLTVRLPGIADDNLEWTIEISAPEAFELLTAEQLTEENATTDVASFRSIATEDSSISLIMRHAEPEADKPVETRVLQLAAAADGKLTLESLLERNPAADWIEMGDDGYTFTVRQSGADWSFDILDTEIIELITTENETDFAASFMAPMTKAGATEIYINGTDVSYTLSIFVNESGEIFIEYVESLISLLPAAE